MRTLYTVHDSQDTDRVANWWKEGPTRMSTGAHSADCVIFQWQPHKQLTASFSSRGLEEQAGMSTRPSGVLETSRECVQSCKLVAVTTAVDTHRETYRQIVNRTESWFALHTRTLSTAALHFIHGHYQQLLCTSYTDTINSCFALHTRTLSTAALHFIHGHYQQLFCTSYTDSIQSSFLPNTRTSESCWHFIH